MLLKFHICNSCHTKARLSSFIWITRCKQNFEILSTNNCFLFHDQKLVMIKVIMNYEIYSFVKVFNVENVTMISVRIFVIFNIDDSIIELLNESNLFRLFRIVFNLTVLNDFSNLQRESFTMTSWVEEWSSYYFAFFILSRVSDHNERKLKIHIEYVKFYEFKLFQSF